MVDQQQFCLRWNNHGSTLVAVFDNLLASESLVDVTLFAEGRLLKAHKVVLSACSPYFQTLFAQTTDKHPIVILKDVKHIELKALLDYMYRGEVNVSQDQLGPLIKTAESLKIKGLADGSNKTEADSHTKHPTSHDRLKSENSHADTKGCRSGLDAFPVPPVSVPSVLSTVLKMPPALSLASSNLIPPIKLTNLATTTVMDPCPREDGDSPHAKRRKKMRQKSGETCDSGDSDGRSSGSPGDGIHLPRIPATITPITSHHPAHRDQQQKERERELEREREREREQELQRELDREQEREREREREREIREALRASSPSPESIIGLSRGESRIDIPRSSPGVTRSHSDHDHGSSSPSKPMSVGGRPDENSSDANHQSDDECDDKSIIDRISHDHPDTPGPSTSRLLPEDAPQTPSYLGWPYPPETSASDESFPSLENTNQGLLLCEGWLATGLWGGRGRGVGRSSDSAAAPDAGGGGGVGSGGPAGTHSCPKCGRSYTLRSNLSRHMRLECGVERRYSCTYCHKRFSHAHHLRSHERSIHALATVTTAAATPTATATPTQSS